MWKLLANNIIVDILKNLLNFFKNKKNKEKE